jgi:hypothetical protein
MNVIWGVCAVGAGPRPLRQLGLVGRRTTAVGVGVVVVVGGVGVYTVGLVVASAPMVGADDGVGAALVGAAEVGDADVDPPHADTARADAIRIAR